MDNINMLNNKMKLHNNKFNSNNKKLNNINKKLKLKKKNFKIFVKNSIKILIQNYLSQKYRTRRFTLLMVIKNITIKLAQDIKVLPI